MAASLTRQMRSIRSALPTLHRESNVPRHERPQTEDERLILLALRVADMLRPTILEPFKAFAHPWERTTVSADPADPSAVHDFTTRVKGKIDDFIVKLSTILPWRTTAVATHTGPSLSQIIPMRADGRAYEALCALSALITTGQDTSNLVFLHQADTLRDLSLHDQAFGRRPSYDNLLGDPNKVRAALLLLNTSAGLIGGRFAKLAFEASLSPATAHEIFDGALSRSPTDSYAEIVYCHTIITRHRFTCLVDYLDREFRERLCTLSVKALSRLLVLWKEIKDDPTLEQGDFLRWRCSTALHECIPFSSPAVGLPARRDALFLWATADSHSSPDRMTLDGATVRRAFQLPGAVNRSHLDSIEQFLDTLIAQNDFRQIDELLLALQMPVHVDFYDMQKSLREVTWKLHQSMLPSAPWILDGALLHPLSLWLGEQYRYGGAKRALWFRSAPEPKAVVSDSPLSKLQIGFGPLARTMEDGARFIYAWSILHCCLQCTSSPLDQPIYHRLFLDHDVFSPSQLVNRVRQVCRYTLTDHWAAFEEVTLDGFDERHRHVAASGSVRLVGDTAQTLDLLSSEILALDRLWEDCQRFWNSEPSEGLRHFMGICLVYRGCAHLEKASELLKRTEEDYARHQTLKSELHRAQDLYEKAFAEYKDLEFGEITRMAGEGLIRVQDLLATISAPDDSSDITVQKHNAEIMLKLCQRLSVPLRVRMVQAYATPSFRFEWKGSDSWCCLSTGVGDHPSGLYDAAERSGRALGHEDSAIAWLYAASKDISLGSKLAKSAYPQSAEQSDPVLMAPGCFFSRRKEYTSYVSNAELETVPRVIWENLKPEISRVVIAQYSVGLNDEVQLHLQRSNKVTRFSCGIKHQIVKDNKRYFKEKQWTPRCNAHLRQLDPLVTELSASIRHDELVILLQGTTCRGVLLHILHGQDTIALGDKHLVIYSPDLEMLRNCLLRIRMPPSLRATGWRVTGAAVWESGGETPEEVKAIANSLYATADGVMEQLHGTAFKGTRATKSIFVAALANSECVFFMGHGGAERDQAGNIYPPCLVLSGNDIFGSGDFPNNLPASLLVLLGCSTGDQRTRNGADLKALPDAALENGSVAVVSTRVVIWTDALQEMARQLSSRLREARQAAHHVFGDTRFNLAAAVQRSIEAARKSIKIEDRKVPAELAITAEQLWAPFVLVGSPLVDLRDGEEGAPRS